MNVAATDSTGSASKRDAILEAANKLFLEVGFGAASMDSIASAAQVSKQTVYNHFGSKEELFAAMVRASCDEMTQAFAQAIKANDPEKALRAMAKLFVDVVFTPDKLAMHRILMAEIPRFPDLGRVYYQSGPAIIRKFLADYFTEQNRRGSLKVDDPQIAAEQFISMVTSNRLRVDVGVDPMPSDAVKQRYIDNAVTLIMRACKT
ncbi:MAG: TetR/AcrR family transcriptional regulator [Gammaproteobacteria bacterium]|nr:TetR/AcrR family transcriptional regulator [Gammaproteobacteria bacterium]MDE2346769.1 TetR/AcrR family transcriptional regulator [Gammaproteobacteria bacterium]